MTMTMNDNRILAKYMFSRVKINLFLNKFFKNKLFFFFFFFLSLFSRYF